ncbi:hypothetical protein SDC9_173273 [bioreactor metagenome]|uniref:Uncharacterized protein n=1 Tax=bioreactor metagenome TaxID=1076179 RepID=A0A645GGP4_9ZZZZ
MVVMVVSDENSNFLPLIEKATLESVIGVAKLFSAMDLVISSRPVWLLSMVSPATLSASLAEPGARLALAPSEFKRI